MTLSTVSLETVAFNLIKQAVIYLPKDVKAALRKAQAEETSETARIQLNTMLANMGLAERTQSPICQDTGTLTFYIKAGEDVQDLGKVEDVLVNATRKATFELPLRPNAVNPFNGKNSGDNTGRLIPQVHWEIVRGDSLEMTVMPKGGGSENVSALGMLNPGEGLKGLKRFVIDAAIKAGPQPCPPTVLGVGLGGGCDAALALAKKALLKPLDEVNTEPEVAQLEREIFEAANMTDIGPMGLGGKTTVLAVHIEYAFRHPASLPVAVEFNCWAARRATARIDADGDVEYLTHRGAGEVC